MVMVIGGCEGIVIFSDGNLLVIFLMLKVLGGVGGEGINLE